MHEGAVVAEIIDVVSGAAKTHGLSRVDEIVLTVGPWSGLLQPQMEFYFAIAGKGTCMENAVLRMEQDDSLTGYRQMFIKNIRGE